MQRLLFAMFTCLLLTALHCQAQSFHTATVKSPAPGTMFIHPDRIPLKGSGMFSAERATMFVPLNRSKAASDVISIDVYRFPRSSKAQSDSPPIFILRGGPGFEGLERNLANQGFFEREIQPFLDISDVVVVGQRGIGSSRPATVIEQTLPPRSAEDPYDPERTAAEFQAVLERERAYWIENGVDLDGFNVVEAAADVRDISAALGYEKIVLYGGSFGSHWGMAIMKFHPTIVERAVLHGMEGPDHTWDHPGWIWNVYKRVADEAELDEELKPLIPDGGLINAMELLVQKARKNPFIVVLNEGKSTEKKVLIDGNAMQHLARGYSGGLLAWPADVITMHNGNFDQAARRILLRSSFRGRDLSTASFWMLDSGSGITAKRLAEFEANPALQVVGSTYWHYETGRPVWQFDLGDQFRQNFETVIPTVIVHGSWDTQTPWENAEELAPYFTNSRFITIKRGSHDAFDEAIRNEPRFRPALNQFLVSGSFSELPGDLELPKPKWTIPAIKQNR